MASFRNFLTTLLEVDPTSAIASPREPREGPAETAFPGTIRSPRARAPRKSLRLSRFPSFASMSILGRRPVHTVDDEGLNRPLGGFEFEPKLLLKSARDGKRPVSELSSVA
jgi:hypothetical protein